MVGNVTIQGQIVGTATFNGAKISAVVTIAPPINATVVFGKSGVAIHNLLTGRDAEDAHPIESITDLPETLQVIVDSIPAPLGFTPENAANKKTTLTNSETDYPSTSAVNRLSELKQTDSPEFANTQITTLDSVDNGGVIDTTEATWLGATAKSVLSYLQKLVSKVYAINSRVEVLEDDIVASVTTSTEVAFVEFLVSVSDNKWLNFSIKTGAITAGTQFRIQVNDVTNGYYSTGTGASLSIVASMGGDTYNVHQGRMFVGSGFISYQGVTIQKPGAANPAPVAFYGGHNSMTTPLTKIKIFPASGLIPIGTNFVISK